jgi:predicted dehydrogenase
MLELAKKDYEGEGVTFYDNYEDFLTHDMDVVVLANYATEHAPFAIKALDKGFNVISEVLPVQTMKEAVELVEAVERSGKKYYFAENCCYMPAPKKMKELYEAGVLGKFEYGEGEYLHNLEELIAGRGENHWRVDGAIPQTTLLGGGPHALDTLRWLMGVTFTHVSAFHADHQNDWGRTTHTTVAIYKADNGATAKITTAYGMIRPYCLYYSVYGSEGSFERSRQQNESGGETTNYLYHSRLSGTDHMIPVTLPNFSNPAIARRFSAKGHGTMEYEQAEGFLRAIIEDREPVIGPREAAASIVPLICGLQIAGNGGGMMEIPRLG